MKYIAYLYAILFVSCFGILTTMRNLYEQYPLIYLICVAGMITSLLCIISDHQDIVEHLQISGEAVQNVGSIYNGEKMVVKDLNITGKLTVGGTVKLPNWTINSSDGQMRFEQDGKGQQFTVHTEEAGGAWSKNIGWHHQLATAPQLNQLNDNIKWTQSNYIRNNSNINLISGASGQSLFKGSSGTVFADSDRANNAEGLWNIRQR
jgi:hypothetical protein